MATVARCATVIRCSPSRLLPASATISRHNYVVRSGATCGRVGALTEMTQPMNAWNDRTSVAPHSAVKLASAVPRVERVEGLLQALSLEEKVGQMSQVALPEQPEKDSEGFERLLADVQHSRIGSFLN